ncbi:hypothetical protein ANN_06995 [Periplaneta americana]|uniref:Uncharacterized protein n=1 Tax=Periplaneta americana TaxID=6978 RepID=A0ABQ8TF69_PERAM|nr:hypothetical protein ANN_06995 [Periplaneta americana]
MDLREVGYDDTGIILHRIGTDGFYEAAMNLRVSYMPFNQSDSLMADDGYCHHLCKLMEPVRYQWSISDIIVEIRNTAYYGVTGVAQSAEELACRSEVALGSGAYSVGSRPTSHSHQVHLSTCVDFGPAFIDIYDVVQRAATGGNQELELNLRRF